LERCSNQFPDTVQILCKSFEPWFGAFLLLEINPYVNQSILKLKSECGGDFVKGTKLNWQKLNRSDTLILDSLAMASPEKLVQYANCDPENAWTLPSIENQFNGILYRAAITVLFFAVGFDLITKVLTGSR